MNKMYDIEWQMKRFNLTREEAEAKIKDIKKKRSETNKLKLSVEWQMNKFGISKEEAESKIAKMRKGYGSSRPKSIEWQMKRFNLTREEAEAKIADILKRTGEGVSKSRLEHPENNNAKKEFYIARGFSEEESEKLVKERIKSMQNVYHSNLKENPEKYASSFNTRIEYYLQKGMTFEEAKEALKERQTTNDIEKYKAKYGEVAGEELWRERQIEWSRKVEAKYRAGEFSEQAYNQKSSCFSKGEKNLVSLLESSFEDSKNLLTLKMKQKHFRTDDGKIYFCDICYKNKIVEYNGDYWHCNPEFYQASYFHKLKNMTAKEIWDYDKKKIEFLKSKNYEVLIVWENEFMKNKETTLEKVIQFLLK